MPNTDEQPQSGRVKAVCHVLHRLDVGGVAMLAGRLARGLADRHRFVFACLGSPGPLAERLGDEGCAIEVIGHRPGVDFGCMRRLAEFWRRHDVGLVHAHQYTPFFYSLAARRWRRRPPILFTEHGHFYADYPRSKRMLLNRLMLRRGDRVVGVSEAVRQSLILNEGIPSHRVEVIHNGVDCTRFAPAAPDRADVRRLMGFEPEDVVVLQVARFDPLKDHATALRAIARAVRTCPRLRLVLVGDGPERGRIECQVRDLGIVAHVQLLGTRDDVARLLLAADLLLLTSISEGISATILEAMASGVAVVSTDVGGVSEIVVHGQTGLLAPAAEAPLLARHILQMANDRDFRSRMGEAGARRAAEKFSQQRMHDAYRRCYAAMLDG